MKPILTAIFLTLCTWHASAQQKMRPVEELINTSESAWTFLEQDIKKANNKVEVLPADTAKARKALYHTQVTTRSPMGAIVFMTGGLLIDDGWIRILGSGSTKLNRSLPDWNKGKTFTEFGDAPAYLLIADDAVGGFFLLNGGGLGSDMGKVYYFAPDNLEYQPLGITYSEFLMFCFNNDLDQFYQGLRWENWRSEVSKLDGNSTFTFFPYLWTEEGRDINAATRSSVPVDEQYQYNLAMREQLGVDN